MAEFRSTPTGASHVRVGSVPSVVSSAGYSPVSPSSALSRDKFIPGTSPKQDSSGSGSMPDRIYTSYKGVLNTIDTLRQFCGLLRRVCSESPADMPEFETEAFKTWVAGIAEENREKVVDRRKGIESEMVKVPDVLAKFRVYLRRISTELMSTNLSHELQEIDKLLKTRTLPAPSPSSSPVKGKPVEDMSPSLKEAWDKFGQVAVLQAEFALLKKKFGTVKEASDASDDEIEIPPGTIVPIDRFERECRKAEVVAFLKKVADFTIQSSIKQKDTTKAWQLEELETVKKKVKDEFEKLKGCIDREEHYPSMEQLPLLKVDRRVTRIVGEFAANTELYEKVTKCRELYLAIQKQKAIVAFENEFEHFREKEIRLRLHTRLESEMVTNSHAVKDLSVGDLIGTLGNLMETVNGYIRDIEKMYEHTKKVMLMYDQTMQPSKDGQLLDDSSSGSAEEQGKKKK